MISETLLWQEAWATLAQAWRPPTTEAQCQAVREYLAGDLASLGLELGAKLETQALQEGLAEQDDQELLVGYARLFLTPPQAAYLDLGSGVEGAQMGLYAQAMAQTLSQLCLAMPQDSHEHPDYLPVMLEVAQFLESEASETEAKVSHLSQLMTGLKPLCQSLGGRAPDTPWYQLASVTRALVQQRLLALGYGKQSVPAPNPAELRRDQRDALTVRVQEIHQGETVSEGSAIRARQAGIPAEAMLEMIANLEAQGLDASHLRGQLPAECWASLIPPQAKHGRTSQQKPPLQRNTGVTNKL